MQVNYEPGDLLVTIVLAALFMIIAFGLSCFIPNIIKEVINHFKHR